MIVLPRSVALVAFALTLAPILSWPAALQAQDYPTRPVRIIVPFGAGGPADVYSRVLAQHLSEALKQPFVVEDRPGAGSIIGTDAVAKSPPDGYTLLAMSNTHTTNESLIANKPFQLMRDFVPVAGINYSDLVMVVHPSVPAKDLKEFIAYAKTKPGELNYASSGAGTPYHMAAELFKAMSGTNLVHVPHKASGEMRNSVIGGHVQMAFDAITTMAPNVKAAQVRALGTSAARRSTVLPDVPTIAEAGGAGLRVDHLARDHGAGRHAEGDRRRAQCRNQQGDQPPRREGSMGQAGSGGAGDDARRVRKISACRHREMGAGGEDGGTEGGVTSFRGCAWQRGVYS
jgi:tripartite-type tricarboxylate transporter receptor subunit TctC